MRGGSQARHLAFELAQPFQRGAKLLNHESDHPHRLMMWMADLLQNGTQCLLLASQLLVDEPAATLKLLFENPGAREPGKRDPSGKNWTVPAGGPAVALQSIGRRLAAARRGLEDGALRSGRSLAALRFANDAGRRRLFQRLKDLLPGNCD